MDSHVQFAALQSSFTRNEWTLRMLHRHSDQQVVFVVKLARVQIHELWVLKYDLRFKNLWPDGLLQRFLMLVLKAEGTLGVGPRECWGRDQAPQILRQTL